ncbi:MAG: peptide ABC transporter substrate-binding protein, partial [Gammaproteobacteria bacterium]|nr:peptide ABC transporter substrate-binding protein [Gammaproteobacteria bacterium]
MAVTDTPIDSEESFARSAGKQLAIYALYALVLLASLIYVFSLVAGRTGSGTSGGAVDVANNSVTTTLRQEPPQLDAGRSTDASSFVVLAHVMEGLLAYDDNMQLIPGMAERWEVREDGATFWIRDEALWSNGDSVTAHDFEFAWKRVVDPDTASEYAFILYPILNAEAITQGELPKEMLGVQAVDDQTLEVQFAQPTPYFDKLVAFNTYLPLQQEFYESTDGRYGADAEYMIYNGPYVVEEWIHGASMLWRKNPTYWGDHKGFLDEINAAYITTDINAKLNLFKDGQIAETQLLAPMLPEAMEKRWQIDR